MVSTRAGHRGTVSSRVCSGQSALEFSQVYSGSMQVRDVATQLEEERPLWKAGAWEDGRGLESESAGDASQAHVSPCVHTRGHECTGMACGPACMRVCVGGSVWAISQTCPLKGLTTLSLTLACRTQLLNTPH